MVLYLPQRPIISVGDVEKVSINFTDHLDSGESLTGTPTVVEVTTSNLNMASKSVNAATYIESQTGETVAIGKAVQFTVTGGLANNSPYTLNVTVSTDATPARTFVRRIYLSFE